MKLTLLLFLVLSCTFTSAPKKTTLTPSDVKSWGLQLQSYTAPYDLPRIRSSDADLWVMDMGVSKTENFTSTQINILKTNDKKIIAYMSIGEAESYRYYFASMPTALKGEVNTKWSQNYTVHFWEKAWQDIFISNDGPSGKSYLDRIQDAAFDGVFLDVIDAYERFNDQGAKAIEMANFIIRISQKAKARNKDFVIILQNGLQIRRLLPNAQPLLDAIDGVNVEHTFFEGDRDFDNVFHANPAALEDIHFFQNANKFVLSLEYLQDPKLIDQYFKYAQEIKISPLAAEKKLAGPLTIFKP
jgi:cysteinyl-tRNA synthetase